MEISETGIGLLKAFEGCRLVSYQDSVGVWTIGYGCTTDVDPGMKITQAEAEDRLKADLTVFENCVNDAVKVPLNQNQFDALVCWTYNLGCRTLQKSKVLTLLNEGDYDGAEDHMKLYDRAGGQVLAGLTRRRLAEARLFSTEVV